MLFKIQLRWTVKLEVYCKKNVLRTCPRRGGKIVNERSSPCTKKDISNFYLQRIADE